MSGGTDEPLFELKPLQLLINNFLLNFFYFLNKRSFINSKLAKIITIKKIPPLHLKKLKEEKVRIGITQQGK